MNNNMDDMFDKFTSHYKKSILNAYGLSLGDKKKEIGIQELFWAVLAEKGSLGQETLLKAGIKKQTETNKNLAKNEMDLERIIKSKELIPLSDTVKKIIIESTNLATNYEHTYIGTEHLLYSLIEINDGTINNTLREYKIKSGDLLKNLEMILNSTSKFSDMTEAMSSLKQKIKQNDKKAKKKDDSMLEFFGTELTDDQVQKNINPVIGREEEIRRVIQILSRRDKNNPILLGEPGVGKTAIIEGLAKKIMQGQVPDLLLGKKIYSLDMPLLVAGTSYRGEFEARIKQIVEEVKRDEDIILFIDEIHNIMGAGSTSGTMDAANILKPALARGEIRCIGATTYDDYKKHIEPDQALIRRMQRVLIKEPKPEEAIEILKGIKESYEKHHLLTISDAAIEEAVNLSQRYITDQFLPDKAIDLIDEAASKKRISRPQNVNLHKITKLKKELTELSKQKNLLVAQGKYEQALRLKPKEVELINQIYKSEEEEIKNKIKSHSIKNNGNTIDRQDIRNLVRQTTKINIPERGKSNQVIQNLAQNLNKKIIGQEKIIQQLTNTLKRSAAGLTGDRRPLGSFIFAGLSGVGKTYTARILAENISNDKDGLIKLDMSEFAEKFNASKIIGAPAGYVGYDDGGQLTEKVKRNPYSVILLDEIEKAHADIFNLFLQVLEDGYLTDSKGRQVNFKNSIIIMTTNIGVKKQAEKNMMGFENETQELAEDNFKESLREFLRPELLNRIDQVLVFKPLSQRNLAKIIKLELDNINLNLIRQNLGIKWDKAVIIKLLKSCIQHNQGARVIRGVLREELENPLAERILTKPAKGKMINLKVKDGKIIFE